MRRAVKRTMTLKSQKLKTMMSLLSVVLLEPKEMIERTPKQVFEGASSLEAQVLTT